MSANTSIKTVVVHLATGKQGGSAVRALSRAGFSVRAAVRDATTDRAREVADVPGVELVVVDVDDIQTLLKAYAGADAVVCVTVTGPKETTQGRNMADAAKTAGVRHFIWSALESMSRVTGGEYVVPFYDDKEVITEHIKSIGIPATFLYTPIFLENLVYFPGYSRYIPEEDTIEITSGGVADADKKLPFTRIDVDLGEAVRTIFQNSDAFVGKKVILAPHWQTLKEQAEIVAKVSGRKARVGKPVQFGPDQIQQWIATMWNFWGDRRYGMYRELGEKPDPLLEKYGFKPASVESFVRELLLPHLKLQ